MVCQPLTSLEKFFSAACGVGEGGDGECGDVCGEGEDSGGGSWLAAEWLQLVVAVQGRVVRGSLHQSTNQPHTTPTTSYYTTPTTSYYTHYQLQTTPTASTLHQHLHITPQQHHVYDIYNNYKLHSQHQTT